MKKTHQHSIDFLFPIALFFAFSATALLLLLLAANLYQGIVTISGSSFEQETTLSYLVGKIRQHDISGTDHISLSTFDGHDCLAIRHDYEDISYVTYIYEIDGELKELFLQEGVDASAASGTTIMEIEELTMEAVRPDLFRFTCTSGDGSSDSILIQLNSEGGSYE